MDSIITQLFSARDTAHRLHLKVRSFSAHIALGELYELLVEKADQLAETYQGKYGIIPQSSTATINMDSNDPIVFIRQLATWVESVKQLLNKDDSHILNIWDEVIAAVYRVKYKLETLV